MRNIVTKNTESVALKAGAWYVISSISVKAVSIITTPIFTRLMTTKEYGYVATFTTWYSLLSVFCTLNLSYSIGRAKLDFPDKLDNYIGSMQILSGLVTAIISVFMLIFINPLSRFMELDQMGIILLILYLLFSPAINFYQNGFRYRYRYKENIGIAWYTTITSVMLSLALMYLFDSNREILRMLGITMPTVFLSTIFWLNSIKKGYIKYCKEFWSYGLKLSLPLVLHTVSLNILAQSDRIFIAKFGGVADVGIYSLVYTYGIMISIITNAIADGWLPWFHDNYSAKEFNSIRTNVKPIVLLGCFLSLACISLTPEAIFILGGENYLFGIGCVPPIVLGILCQYIYTHYVNIELHLKKTKFVSFGTIFAALLNIILNAIFVPIYGFVAAAYTTFFSYICLLVIHYFITRFVLKINLYQNKFMFLCMIITTLIAGILVMTYSYRLLRYGLIFVGFLAFLWEFRGYIINYINKHNGG